MNYSYNEEKAKKPLIIWALLTFLGIFNWILFYYAGLDSKDKRYIYVGHFYLIISTSFILSVSFNWYILSLILAFFALFGYPFGILYSFITLSSYRKRLVLLGKLTPSDLLNHNIGNLNNIELEHLVNTKSYNKIQTGQVFQNTDEAGSYNDNFIENRAETPLKKTPLQETPNIEDNNFEKININSTSESEFTVNTRSYSKTRIERVFQNGDEVSSFHDSFVENITETPSKKTSFQETTDIKDNNFEKININSASESELLLLPEITPEIAKRIISVRDQANGFNSIDELETLVTLTPYIISKLQNKIIFGKFENKNADNSSEQKNKRILDI
ncbi:helix-hairpin-helix domain-containing protein [Sebaldella sp. S0638]|uniref:ComEA family DNA-binding protein n=1 Tax=Sebaldella sp. S0638 TaxID=2957809 RepID=UPI00209DB57D|nr:helix-hairpin-helix domain-containing protein [Sebaldella sp. S0638]MCP1225550.1 helix-hairpin-helix domain-containing protein [Sebaldella sp. S0638]